MNRYRMLWERKQLGNTMVDANSIEEVRKIAEDRENNQAPLNFDMTDKTKQIWHFVDAYCIKYENEK